MLATANAQVRLAGVLMEEFHFIAADGSTDPTAYYGTFGDPQIMPVMTRSGYQDHLVTPLKVETTLFATWTGDQLNALARRSLIRTQTGRTFYIQTVDYTGVVVFTFICTDREL